MRHCSASTEYSAKYACEKKCYRLQNNRLRSALDAYWTTVNVRTYEGSTYNVPHPILCRFSFYYLKERQSSRVTENHHKVFAVSLRVSLPNLL